MTSNEPRRMLGTVSLLCFLVLPGPLVSPAMAQTRMRVDVAQSSTIISITQQAEFTPKDGQQQDQFGKSVALSGDTALVNSLSSRVQTGAVYVFSPAPGNGVWSQRQKLAPSDPEPYEHYGTGMAFTGDSLLVGAPSKTHDTGALYVYTRAPHTTIWRQKQEFAPPGDQEQVGGFGGVLAQDGNTILVASSGNSLGTGAAYFVVQDAVTSAIRIQQVLHASDGHNLDDFGTSVAVSGDSALVGAPETNNHLGGVYVFTRDPHTGSWTQRQKLSLSKGGKYGALGDQIALSGDTAFIHAWGDNGEASVVYVFIRNPHTGVWHQQQVLTSSYHQPQDDFGLALAMSNGMALIGAPGEHKRRGAVYIFTRDANTGAWRQAQEVTAQGSSSQGGFGWSIAVSDGRMLVGAPYNKGIGSAYLFQFKPEPSR